MEFLLLGIYFSVAATAVMVVLAYLIVAISSAIWYLAEYAQRSVLRSTKTLATYTDSSRTVLQTSKLRTAK